MRQTVCTIRQRVIPSLFAASVFLTLDVRASGELSSLDRRAMFNIPVMEYSFTACAAYGQTERESERTCPFVIEFTRAHFTRQKSIRISAAHFCLRWTTMIITILPRHLFIHMANLWALIMVNEPPVWYWSVDLRRMNFFLASFQRQSRLFFHV